MKYSHRLAATLLSSVAVSIACGADDDQKGEPHGGASGSAGRGGASGNAASHGGADEGGAGGNGGAAPAEGGLGGGAPAGSAGEGLAGVGGQAGAAAQSEHWLAFQLWMEDQDTHPLFVTAVPPQANPVQITPNVDFWQWTPDGTRLVYATPAAYGGPPNAAFSIALSATGALGAPEPLHEPLEEGAYAWRVSISPNSETLALQLYEDETSTWYLRPLDGGVDDWAPVAEPVSGPEAPLVWSPDGSRAAIIQREDATSASLSIVDAATGEGTQGSFGTLRPFQWSADGSRFFVETLGPGAGQRVLYAIDADAASDAVELSDPAVHSGFDPSKFAVSSDGDTVAFMARVGGSASVFIKQVGGAQPARQLVGENPSAVVWSEGSARFLYIATHLYAVPRQGGDAIRLNPEGTTALCNAPPCLRSADDALLLMTSDANQDLIGNQLYDIDLSTPSPSARLLTTFTGGTTIDFLAVAPDPSQVLLLATDAAGQQSIYLVDRRAAPPSATPPFNPPPGTYPTAAPMGWSPDSRLFHLVAAPKGAGYIDLLTATLESRTATLSAPVTPQGRKLASVAAEWRPRPLL
jgi:Tol biopolymer transport system component